MSIKKLISDINAAVEWYTDYQEDDKAGEELLPFDMITSAYAYNNKRINQEIIETLKENELDINLIDFDQLIDRLLHFHLEYKTGHIFSGNDDTSVLIESYPIQEHHTQFDIDPNEHGRITEKRLQVIEREIEACLSSYTLCNDGTVQSLDLCWVTDAVWMVYVSKDSIIEAYNDILGDLNDD